MKKVVLITLLSALLIYSGADFLSKFIFLLIISVFTAFTLNTLKTKDSSKYFLSLLLLINPFLLVVLPSIYFIFQYNQPKLQLDDFMLYGLISLIYHLFYVKAILISFNPSFKKNIKPKIKYIKIFGLFFVLLFTLIRLLNPISIHEFHNELRFEGDISSKSNFAVSQLKWIMYLASGFLTYVYFNSKKKLDLLMLILTSIGFSIYCLYLQNRGDIFAILVIILSGYLITRNRKIKLNFSKIFALIALITIVWSYSTNIRNADLKIDSNSNMFKRLSTFVILDDIFFNPNFIKIQNLSIVKEILNPIPSKLNPFIEILPDPFKNFRSIGNAAAYFLGNYGSGTAVPLAAEMIWRFGPFLGLLVCIIFGKLVGTIYNYINNKSSFLFLLMIISMSPQLIFNEDFFLFWPLLIRLSIIIIILNKILKKIV